MTTTPVTDFGQTTANAMLTTKASKVLSTLVASRPIDSRQAAVLHRAAGLIERIVEGSLFIENKGEAAGLAPSHIGLAEYERAISAARTLNLVGDDRDLTELFMGYRSTLVSLSEGKPVSTEPVAELRRFMLALSEFFYSDLMRSTSEDRTRTLFIEA